MNILTKTNQKLCETQSFYPIHQAIVQIKDVIISKKNITEFVKILNEEIKVFKIPSGRIYHIKKYDKRNCIICAGNKIYIFNIQSDTLIELKMNFARIVIFT